MSLQLRWLQVGVPCVEGILDFEQHLCQDFCHRQTIDTELLWRAVIPDQRNRISQAITKLEHQVVDLPSNFFVVDHEKLLGTYLSHRKPLAVYLLPSAIPAIAATIPRMIAMLLTVLLPGT